MEAAAGCELPKGMMTFHTLETPLDVLILFSSRSPLSMYLGMPL